MKLLAVDQDAVPAGDRGFWRALNATKECEITLVVPRLWKAGEVTVHAGEESSQLRVIPMTTAFAGKSHRAFYPGLIRLVRTVRPDLLFVNAEPESFLCAQAARIKRSTGTPLMCMTWRNIDYGRGEFPYTLPFLNDIAQSIVFRNADICIAHNKPGVEILQRRRFRNVRFIPPSVDTEVFTYLPRSGRRKGKEPRGRTIGYVGRLDAQKGVDLLLRACAGLIASTRLIIVGSGPHEHVLRALARELKIESRITWIPWVPHPEVARQLQRMDVLVLPSRTTSTWKEQFGRVLIEAMACGTAVVGSDSGEIPQVIGDAGFIFAEGDIGGLEKRLKALARKENIERLVKKGIQRVTKFYSIPVVMRQWQKILREVASNVTPIV
jgi:glycosyltransferase involved in cell wall biosynthesis